MGAACKADETMAKVNPAIVMVVRVIDVIFSGLHAIDACTRPKHFTPQLSVQSRRRRRQKTTLGFKSRHEAPIPRPSLTSASAIGSQHVLSREVCFAQALVTRRCSHDRTLICWVVKKPQCLAARFRLEPRRRGRVNVILDL